MKLARVGIELFEERDIHRCVFAVVSTCETPAVCAKADQLSPLLHPARGDHGDRLLRAVTMLAAHMLTSAFRLHVPLPGHRRFLIAPWSLTQNHLLSYCAWQCPALSFLLLESLESLSVLGRLHFLLSRSIAVDRASSRDLGNEC